MVGKQEAVVLLVQMVLLSERVTVVVGKRVVVVVLPPVTVLSEWEVAVVGKQEVVASLPKVALLSERVIVGADKRVVVVLLPRVVLLSERVIAADGKRVVVAPPQPSAECVVAVVGRQVVAPQLVVRLSERVVGDICEWLDEPWVCVYWMELAVRTRRRNQRLRVSYRSAAFVWVWVAQFLAS